MPRFICTVQFEIEAANEDEAIELAELDLALLIDGECARVEDVEEIFDV